MWHFHKLTCYQPTAVYAASNPVHVNLLSDVCGLGYTYVMTWDITVHHAIVKC